MLNLLTGFGTPNTQEFVRFNVLVPRDTSVVPDWHPPLRIVEDGIVGSSDVEVQVLGFDAAKVTHTLLFRRRDDYYDLQAMLGHKRTLVMLAGQSRFRGTVRHLLGHDYAYHDNILLTDLEPEFRVGATLARATFTRSASGLGVGQW